ncbi:ABC transporter permease [Actinocorallia longicatena]|uniref:ABC transporter permease n=1 Tax=Actinocorallia longicatena TaxID=111803 RepID=A0ABP6QEM4_9ACTN
MIVKRVSGTLLSIGVSLALVLGAWIAFIEYFSINPMVIRSPRDVWTYLFTAEEAGAHRSVVWDGLRVTLADAGAGMVAGLVAAAVVAMLFVLSRTVEQAFLPVAMIVRSVPLIAMTPVLTLVFGRELLGTTVIVGIVVFFPALVTLVFGLRSASPQAADLVRAYGGSTWTTLRKVMIPSALPSFFTAARISAPGAIIGALLAEWLATGKGIGYRMLQDVSTFESDDLWSSVVAITLASLVIYSAIGVVEAFVLARYGPAPARR